MIVWAKASPSPLITAPLVMRCGSEVLPLLTEYGTGALQAYYRYGEDAFASGRPSGP